MTNQETKVITNPDWKELFKQAAESAKFMISVLDEIDPEALESALGRFQKSELEQHMRSVEQLYCVAGSVV